MGLQLLKYLNFCHVFLPAETLTNRIEELSKEMEVVIAWVQKSSDLVGNLNQIKYQLTELSNQETSAQSIEWKLNTLEVL